MSIIANENKASGGGVAYSDLRQWLEGVTELGELKTIRNVHWDREMGAMVEMCYRRQASKTAALLFDDVPGYPSGYRCLYGMMCSPRRFAYTVGIDVSTAGSTMEYLKRYRMARRRNFRAVS